MTRTDRRIDVFSLVVGVLISLAAQGIYDSVFYFAQGKILEEVITVIIVLMVILLISAIILVRGLLKKT